MHKRCATKDPLDYSRWDSLNDGSSSEEEQAWPPEVLCGHPPSLLGSPVGIGDGVQAKEKPPLGLGAKSVATVSGIPSSTDALVDFPVKDIAEGHHVTDFTKVCSTPQRDHAAAGAAAAAAQELRIGSTVIICGLKKAVMLNGCSGVVKGRSVTSQGVRWQVEIRQANCSVETKLILTDNLLVHNGCSFTNVAGAKQANPAAAHATGTCDAAPSQAGYCQDGIGHFQEKTETEQACGPLREGSVVYINGVSCLKKKLFTLNGRHGVVRSVPNQECALVELHTSGGGSETKTIPQANLILCSPSNQELCQLLEDVKVALARDAGFRTELLFAAQASAQEVAADQIRKLQETVASLRQEVGAKVGKKLEAPPDAKLKLPGNGDQQAFLHEQQLRLSAEKQVDSLKKSVADLKHELQKLHKEEQHQRIRARALQDRLKNIQVVKDAKEKTDRAAARLRSKEAEVKHYLREAGEKEKTMRETESKIQAQVEEQRRLNEKKARKLQEIADAREELRLERQAEEERRASDLQFIRQQQQDLTFQTRIAKDKRARELDYIRSEKEDLERRRSMEDLVESFEEKREELERRSREAEERESIEKLRIRKEMLELERRAEKSMKEMEEQRQVEEEQRCSELKRIREERMKLESRKRTEEVMEEMRRERTMLERSKRDTDRDKAEVQIRMKELQEQRRIEEELRRCRLAEIQQEKEELEKKSEEARREIEWERARLQRLLGQGYTPVGQGVWQFMDNSGSWTSFGLEQSESIMNAFVRGDKECSFNTNGTTYVVDLAGLVQRNASTQRVRQIRCNFGLPGHWSQSNADLLKGLRPKSGTTSTSLITQLRSFFSWGAASEPSEKKSLKFENVAVRITDPKKMQDFTELLQDSVFHKGAYTGGHSPCDLFKKKVRVHAAFHVENVSLFRNFIDQCQLMRRKHMDHGISPGSVSPPLGPALQRFGESLGIPFVCGSLNEYLLFHGTTFDIAKQISVGGFDSRVSRAGYYGWGTYFASQSCKSNQYAHDGTMILARVALGDPFYATKVDSEMRRPPERPSGSTCHDSVIARPGPMDQHSAGMQTHMEFVVFEQMQAYPEYILRYDMV